MDFFDTLAFDLDFNRAEAHEPIMEREYDEDSAAREFQALNLAFN